MHARSSALAALLLALACSRPARQAPGPVVSSAPAAVPEAPVGPLPGPVLAAPARLVAIGDIHGDLVALRAALRLAGAIDVGNHWSGGALVVVQTGDLVDRGNDDREVVDEVERLADEARRAGGALYSLDGNHELMNAHGDFRYVTPHGFDEFGASPHARAVAFAPGGPYARRLASHPMVLVVGDTVFVHGGLLPSHVAMGLGAINEATRAYMLGERAALPEALEGEDSPVWLRRFSLQDDGDTCELAAQTLAAAHVHRMVVGHTVQERGINAVCDGRVWRIDVGLSRFYHGPMQVLEITGATARVLGAAPPD